MSAPLSSRLLFLPRELPKYIASAYKTKFEAQEKKENIIIRLSLKVYRFFLLIKELLIAILRPTSRNEIRSNIKRLKTDFDRVNERLKKDTSQKDLCVYFVGSHDNPSGAILGNHLYYYHHYKIKEFEKHYSVAAKVIQNSKEIFAFLNHLKAKYPNRKIKVVDIVSHGSPSCLFLGSSKYRINDVKYNQFNACDKDADIILDACSTAKGAHNLAETIARENPQKNVFGCSSGLFFSKPLINKITKKVENVIHGFALLKAYTSKKYTYPMQQSKWDLSALFNWA